MTESMLPGNVRRLEIPGGVRYVLPRRPSIGGMMFIPLGLGAVFAIVGSLVVTFTVVHPLPSAEGDLLIPKIMGFVFAGVGLILLPVGIFTGLGHIEIDLAGDHFRIISRAGFLRWTRSRPSQGLRIITAVHTPGTENDRPMTGVGGEMAMLRATWEGGSTVTVASAYPISWLSGIANDLSKRLGAAVEVVREGQYQSTAATISRQPAGSNAVLRPVADGLTLVLPPRGVWKGSAGYLSFGLLWVGMMILLNVFAYFIIREIIAYICVTVFMVVFSGVGWAMLFASINLGRRKAVLEVSAGRLTLSVHGPFAKKRHEWSLADIVRIHCGPSGRTTNGIPHMALSIQSKGEPSATHLQERDPVELRWIADVLTAELQRVKGK